MYILYMLFFINAKPFLQVIQNLVGIINHPLTAYHSSCLISKTSLNLIHICSNTVIKFL